MQGLPEKAGYSREEEEQCRSIPDDEQGSPRQLKVILLMASKVPPQLSRHRLENQSEHRDAKTDMRFLRDQ